jgi:hypothetical protein
LHKLVNSLLRREKPKTHKFLKEKKLNPKLWNEVLAEVKD